MATRAGENYTDLFTARSNLSGAWDMLPVLESTHPPFEGAYQAALTRLLVCLEDLMRFCDAVDEPYDATNDVPCKQGVDTVKKLIRFMRDAACHSTSSKRKGQNYSLDFGFMINCGPDVMNIAGTWIGSDYPDDMAIWTGEMRIYRDRHIAAALAHAQRVFDARWNM